MYIPLYVDAVVQGTTADKVLVLAADIGGTKSNLALYEASHNRLNLLKEAQVKSNDFNDVNHILSVLLSENDQPDIICLGVAGPVLDGRVQITNLPWGIVAKDISERLDRIPVYLLNDLEATSYGLTVLTQEDIRTLYQPERSAKGNIALIAPGTGLGESALYFDGTYYHPFATEGGHCDFGPRTAIDTELYVYLQKKFGHVSWERLVSGNGIKMIFDFLSSKKDRVVPLELSKLLNVGDRAKVITDHMNAFDICKETVQLFLRYLATESGNLALKMKATGGVFIGGGIVPKIIDKIDTDEFVRNFRDFGRLKPMLSEIPMRVILNEKAAVLGAAYYGISRYRMDGTAAKL